MARILVTGGAGYIGSHFVLRAKAEGHDVSVLDNLSMGHRWAIQSERFHNVDLADESAVLDVLKREQPDAIAHFAAFTYVGESVENPAKYFENNYVNTMKLLRVMSLAGVRRFIFSSSCAVYGEPARIPMDETLPTNPVNPYGLSKLFVEQSLPWFEGAHGIKHVSLRYFNASGADAGLRTGEVHKPETHIIPLVLDAAIGRKPDIKVFGNDYDTPDGTCIRDYIHVDDLCSAHMLALDYLDRGGQSDAFNLGGSRGHTVMEVIETSRRITGREIKAIIAQRRPGDAPHLVADSSRALDVLGWKPAHGDLGTIIGSAWRWHQRAYDLGYL